MIPLNEIKSSLINACGVCDPLIFKPFINAPNVSFDHVPGHKFYSYFATMLNTAKYNSKSNLVLKIEKQDNFSYYYFYDNYHLHPRLTFKITEEFENIDIELLPF